MLDKSEKPRLKQFGPYVFEERMEKVDIKHQHQNGTVSFTRKRIWHYKPQLSTGSLDDNITTVNFPVLTAAQASASMSYFMRFGIQSALSGLGTKAFVTKPVRELLFEGYHDDFLSMGAMFGPSGEGMPPMDKFGWFYKRNGTTWSEGRFNAFTGETDAHLFGSIKDFNGKNQTHYAGECGKIHGSAEGFYPPFGSINRHMEEGDPMPSRLDMYTNEACRALTFTNTGETKEHHGLIGRKYILDNNTFANGTVNPENSCFENNLPSGVQNVTQCNSPGGMSAPIFLSFPHFYSADPFYVNQFSNDSDLAPSKDLHEPGMTLETTLSVPIELSFKLQLVVKIDPIEDIEPMSKLPSNLYLPTIWFEAYLLLPEREAGTMYQLINMPSTMKVVCIVGAVLCCMVLMLSAFCTYKLRREEAMSKIESGCSSSASSATESVEGDNEVKKSFLPQLEDPVFIKP